MRNRGQSTLEYALLIAVLIAGLFGMQVYIKRALAGKLSSASDQMSAGVQYSPGATNGLSVTHTQAHEYTRSQDQVTTSNTAYNITYNKDEATLSFSQEPAR